MALTDIAVHQAAGLDWRGYRNKVGRRATVYFALERGNLVERRLYAHRLRDNLPADTPIAVVSRIIDLLDRGCVQTITLEELLAILDQHPVEVDRDSYLRRCLAQQLLLLDRLEVTFGKMAFDDRDTAAATLLVKVAERRSTLLGLNAPIGHAVRVVQHPPEHRQNATDRIEAAIDALIRDQRLQANGQH